MDPMMLAAGVSSIGKLFGGIGRRNAARAQAKQAQLQAQNARREAGIAASIGLEEADRVGARAATMAAASGGGGLQGSALAVLDDLARQGMYRARQTIRDGIVQSVALQNQSKALKQQGNIDLFGSMLDASATMLGSMGSAAQARRAGG